MHLITRLSKILDLQVNRKKQSYSTWLHRNSPRGTQLLLFIACLKSSKPRARRRKANEFVPKDTPRLAESGGACAIEPSNEALQPTGVGDSRKALLSEQPAASTNVPWFQRPAVGLYTTHKTKLEALITYMLHTAIAHNLAAGGAILRKTSLLTLSYS